MRKKLLSDRGGTLILVLGAIIVVTIMIAPLVMAMNTGHLQALTDANYEKANAKAESMAVVFQRLLLEDQDSMDSAEILKNWNNELQRQFSFCENGSMNINEDSEGNPNEVAISCTEGTGQTARTSTVKFQLRFNPGGGELPFYQQHAVVTSYEDDERRDIYNDVFYAHGTPDLQPPGFLNNEYDPEKYEQEFAEYFNRFNNRPLPRVALAIPDKVKVISDTNNELELNPNSIDNIQLNESVKAGADIKVDKFKKLVVKGDLLSKKSILINNSKSNGNAEMIVEGDLIAADNITINGVAKLTVKGKVIAGGTIEIGNVQGHKLENVYTVEGDMSAQNIYFNTSSLSMVSIGKWGDVNSLIVGNILHFQDMPILLVTGDISARSVPSRFNVPVLAAGGSFIVGSSIGIDHMGWTIAKSLSVGGDLQTTNNSLIALQVGESLYANGVISMGSNKASMLRIGGSMIASGDIFFPNNVYKPSIGKDILSDGRITFKHIDESFHVGGYLMAKNNIDLKFIKENDEFKFGGFYTGGKTSFPGSFNNGSGDDAIAIEHTPLPDESRRGPKIGFGSWSSGQ